MCIFSVVVVAVVGRHDDIDVDDDDVDFVNDDEVLAYQKQYSFTITVIVNKYYFAKPFVLPLQIFATITNNITFSKTAARTLQEPSRGPGRGVNNSHANSYLSKNPISKA